LDSFTISQLQRYSGISVHSIRAWEKRYHALRPQRTEGNTRYYDGDQLRRLLNIASLMHSSYKISELCSLPDSKLYELISQSFENSELPKDELLVSQMVSAAMNFDHALFEKVFSRAMKHYGMENTYLQVIYPALQRVGVMWSADSIAPAQEHFISYLIRWKLDSCIDSLPIPNDSAPHWLLFLPENEFHETGLLMAHYLIRQSGHRCTYLGANVPSHSLQLAVQKIKPDYLFTFLVAGLDQEADATYILNLAKNFPTYPLFISASNDRLKGIPQISNVVQLHSPADLKATLQKMNITA
jgi:MerR family transcriptional regulator, light-induced transcriptional regulator